MEEIKEPDGCSNVEEESSFIQGVLAEAENGSVSHQIFMGRHYLKQALAEVNTKENSKKAVHWLIKASRQGEKEATTLLQECLQNKTGITDDNIDDVRWCLNTSDLDKSTRIAAGQLFQQLKPPPCDGEVPLTFTQEIYSERVKHLFQDDKKEMKFLLSTGKKLRSPDIVEEEDFVETVTRRMRSGQIDPTKDDIEMEAFKQATLLRKITKYPATTIAMASDTVMDTLTTDIFSMLLTFVPFDQMNILIIFFLFSLLSLSWLFRTLVLITYYISFSLMIITTLQMLKNKRKQAEVKSMAMMLKRHSPGIDENEAQAQFARNSMRPYWIFWSALFVCIPNFIMANKNWIPCSEFSLVSLLLCVACFIILSDFRDPLVIFTVTLDILSTLPHLLAGFPKVRVLSGVFCFLTSNLASLQILPNLYINISIPSIGYLILPALFIHMARKTSFMQALIPHLVTCFWWQVGILYYDNSTWLGLARGSLGWATFAVLFPFITVGGMIYGVYYSITAFSFKSIAKVVVTILLILIPIVLGVWQSTGYALGPLSLRGRSFRFKIMAILVPILLLSPSVFLFGGDVNEGPKQNFISYEVYQAYCGKQAWEESNVAFVQEKCDNLKFMQISWTGRVKDVSITEIENPANAFMETMPAGIGEWMKCIYGIPYPECNEEKMSKSEYEICKLRLSYGRKCHMRSSNSYTFFLTIAPQLPDESYPQDVTLKAGDEFKDILFSLKNGDQVHVDAILTSGVGSQSPSLSLKHLTCLSCLSTLQEAYAAEIEPMEIASDVIVQSINFFSTPLVEYRKPRLHYQSEGVTQSDQN